MLCTGLFGFAAALPAPDSSVSPPAHVTPPFPNNSPWLGRVTLLVSQPYPDSTQALTAQNEVISLVAAEPGVRLGHCSIEAHDDGWWIEVELVVLENPRLASL